MSEEIYREYVEKYFFVCKTIEEKEELNKRYLWNKKVSQTQGSMTLFEYNLEYTSKGGCVFFDIDHILFEFFIRKPETHIIRGVEVVAPRYDSPSNCEYCYWIDFKSDVGVTGYDTWSLSKFEKSIIASNGWFYNKEHAEEYVKALREGK